MKKVIYLYFGLFVLLWSCANVMEEDVASNMNLSQKANRLTVEQIKHLSSIIDINDLAIDSRENKTRSQYEKEIENIDYHISTYGDTLLYCVNYKNNGGFLVFSADNKRFPLLAHSVTGNFSFEISKENPINAWIDSEVEIVETNLRNNNIEDAWLQLGNPEYTYEITRIYDLSEVQTRARRTYSAGKELIYPYSGMQLMWGQNSGYNYYAKVNGALAGCPAVAIGMVMWDLYRTPLYTGAYPNSFEFPVWNCPTVITSHQPNSVATLLRNIADKIPNYIWGISFSGASGTDIQTGLRNMGFPNATIKNYNLEEAYTNLNQKKHGIILGGQKSNNDGHVWFCDGYQEIIYRVEKRKNEVVVETWYEYEDALYMNWGNNGTNNGWFESSDFSSFSYNKVMIVNLDYVP